MIIYNAPRNLKVEGVNSLLWTAFDFGNDRQFGFAPAISNKKQIAVYYHGTIDNPKRYGHPWRSACLTFNPFTGMVDKRESNLASFLTIP